MMHDREKSDPTIVAGKPTNKAGQPAAELVEPRVGAEGNASRQSTYRAQYRERVSQALERIRRARKNAATCRYTPEVVRAASAGLDPVEKTQYYWDGYYWSWYEFGWHGPGWYVCDYGPWVTGFWWGGGFRLAPLALAWPAFAGPVSPSW